MKRLIRQAASSDFETLVRIDAACFSPEIAYDDLELHYMMSRRGAETLVLEEDGVIHAFLLMDIDGRRKTATLVTLDVLKEYRRQGHASELLSRAEQILSGYGVTNCILQVDTRNEPALSFYRKKGFEVKRRLRQYYPGGRDAWEMIKRLPTSAGKSPRVPPEGHESPP